MSFDELTDTFGIAAASLIVGFVSGLISFISTEVYVVFASSASPSTALPTIACLSALGQMLAKSIVYLAGRGVVAKGANRMTQRIEQVRAYLENHKHGVGVVILVSGIVGLPPLYAISIAAGGLKIHFMLFFFTGLLGRVVRFFLIAAFPQLVMWFL